MKPERIQAVKLNIKLIVWLVCLFIAHNGTAQAKGLEYASINENQHHIHVLDIDPKEYKIIATLASHVPTRRQTVSSLVRSNGAVAGINGGFFYITPKGEARPAGALKVDSKWLGQPRKPRAAIGWNTNNNLVLVDRILTQSKKNKQNTPVIDVLPQIDKSAKAKTAWQQFDYIVGGTPLLIKNKKIFDNHAPEKTLSSFITDRHARTAVCIKPNQHWLLVVASHTKAADRPYVQNIIEGLTIEELTQFLQKQGCVDAINLDGGGSSTLVLNNKIKNWPAGDCDDLLHMYHERPVLDGILIYPRTTSK